MEKRHKDIMRNLIGKLRHILVGIPTGHGFKPGNLDRELERIGIAPDGTVTPIDALSDIHNGDGYTYRIAATQLTSLSEAQRITARHEIIERAAYTWINRLLALRAMEVRGLIDDTLRGSEDYDGLSEKLYLLRLEHPQQTSDADGGWWAVIQEACNELATALPGLFTLSDPAAALHPTPDTLVQCIALVSGRQPVLADMTLSELDATFADPDAIGWAYQFYQEEAKAAIDAKCKSGGKAASRAEIAAKTQLFTEPYMVQWLLQNSLGRSYHEAYPQSILPATWSYYVTPEKKGEVAEPMPVFMLEELTLLDPCMGSGHFLRAAFDMFVSMYCEQRPELSTVEIANCILSQHLYGIDLDPRAAQLAELTLYLRAWEFVREEERQQRQLSTKPYIPPEDLQRDMHLVTTPTNLDRGALQRHLQRNPQDKVLKSLLEGIFEGLEQANILGSLLHSREYLDSAIKDLQKPHTVEMDFNQEDADFRRNVTELAKHDPKRLRQMLLDRIANSFHAEGSNTDDVSMALFGREAERGVRLLQVLDHHYAVVATNPPYLGSSYMNVPLKKYITKYYPSGKRDIYAAFILRCLELCRLNGRVAMVTMHSWMFLRSFAELWSLSEENLVEKQNKDLSTSLLQKSSIEVLAHLGTNAFEEISGKVVQSVMFILAKRVADKKHQMSSFRLVGLQDSYKKAEFLKKDNSNEGIMYQSLQMSFLSIPLAPLVYWLPKTILELLGSGQTIGAISDPLRGLDTGDMSRFVRWWWETNDKLTWYPLVNGGAYKKWAGLQLYVTLWKYNGTSIKTFPGSIVPNERKYREQGLTFSDICSGSFNCRIKQSTDIFGVSGSAIFEKSRSLEEVAGILNSRLSSYILRAISPTPKFRTGYVRLLPYPELPQFTRDALLSSVKNCIILKRYIVSTDLIEQSFLDVLGHSTNKYMADYKKETILHSLEALNERLVINAYKLDEQDIQAILDETGIPAGWYPLIANYDTLPTLPKDFDLPPLPQELFDYLAAHERISPSGKELARLKANLQALYQAGRGAKNVEQEDNVEENNTDGESEGEGEIISGAYIPIPTETFLEELSVKVKLHPISTYWLLEELRSEGVRCKPEEKRLLEDRLNVLILRLLGYRWPKQIEAGESVPAWADKDGIIPLVSGTGHKTLAERVREQWYEEDGALETQQTEALLEELTGQTLEQWLRSAFFMCHVSQFKHRPIVWQLASIPTKSNTSGGRKKRSSGSAQRTPAFECMLYYHACTGDSLARIRTQYVEPLLQGERGKVDTTTLFAEDATSVFAQERIRELEAFIEKLRVIEEQGFACPELQEIVAEELLDRWSGDGYKRPENDLELRGNEEAWHVDINDGVRVNIAPLQRAGILAKDVLNTKDAKKALGDRVRWRADERRWVREGKLPRCGWMDEQVPDSQAWNNPEAQHNSTQKQLEQKTLLLPPGTVGTQETLQGGVMP